MLLKMKPFDDLHTLLQLHNELQDLFSTMCVWGLNTGSEGQMEVNLLLLQFYCQFLKKELESVCLDERYIFQSETKLNSQG